MTDLRTTNRITNQQKQSFIQRLLDRGVYRLKDKQLYECTIEELQALMGQVDMK
ncbi:Fur-regulated basic protein FbpA [Alkalihalobacillus macyae]|uniref:Fur-regulated basic protein FbpA n=1 Tax=Guptibacillus hwajinpoensis TaxID=208199 RepID=UPI00273B4FAF|nr:Fur-regulated basic protein FbpA [Alkalihalobacillus macyae]MDP4549437.1 Fur-regulated basic protein FbpA [Alkalihalobacillus macyae]